LLHFHRRKHLNARAATIDAASAVPSDEKAKVGGLLNVLRLSLQWHVICL
jgi:hypothetical protein